jgi:hypothetical protein
LVGYFAPVEVKVTPEGDQKDDEKENGGLIQFKTKQVEDKHDRLRADDIAGRGEIFVDH